MIGLKKYFSKLILVLLAFNGLQLSAMGQSTDSSSKRKHYFELSFGQSLLFISKGQAALARSKTSVVLPTNSILFFVEFRPERKIKIPVFLNLPTESKQFLVNGQLINEKAHPSFGTGVQFRLFQIAVDDRSKLDFELGPLVSCIFGGKNDITLAPILAGRIRIKRGQNFVMYIGSSYTIGLDVFGLLYGTGTVF